MVEFVVFYTTEYHGYEGMLVRILYLIIHYGIK